MPKGMIYRRYYNGKEFRADSIDDTFSTKRAATTRANAYTARGYNVRVVRGDYGVKGRYDVYHSVEYSKR